MRIEANLFEVKEKQVLPGGTYNGLLAAPKMEKSKDSGKDMLVFKVKIIDPVGPDYWDQLTYWLVKQDSVGWGTYSMKEICDAAGVNYDPTGLDTDDFEGKQVRVVVEQTIYKDKTQNKIVHFIKAV